MQLPAAYRSLSRPSSAPDAKAFTLRSYSLELPSPNILGSLFFELSEFLSELFVQGYILLSFAVKRLLLSPFALCFEFHLSVKLYSLYF